VVLFVNSPKGFFPEEDIGQILATTEASEDISFKAILALQDQAAELVNSDPNVACSISVIGGGAALDTTLDVFLSSSSQK
jgi:HAE1 family hydrophobic/amphiphilic exporter-1